MSRFQDEVVVVIVEVVAEDDNAGFRMLLLEGGLIVGPVDESGGVEEGKSDEVIRV